MTIDSNATEDEDDDSSGTDESESNGSCNYDITDILLDATTLINGAQTNFTYEVSLDDAL